jgi:hypothetical protein
VQLFGNVGGVVTREDGHVPIALDIAATLGCSQAQKKSWTVIMLARVSA